MRSEDFPGDEPPPIGGSWLRVYTFVLLYTACLITFLYLVSRRFTY